jgi:2-polyprenyl-3-methyl-5-hydroxy-6-metoxy-1,4-benzoquinol methylase
MYDKMNSCYLCDCQESVLRPGSVRDNPTLQVLQCKNCGLVYLSSFDHITVNHYEESGIHANDLLDVNEWLRMTRVDDKRRYEFVKKKITNKTVLDFGCGVGGFLTQAEKSASKVAGIELEKRLQSSFSTRGLSVFSNIQLAIEKGDKWGIITAFHVIEHLPDPISILQELSSLLEEDGELIIEVPNSEDALLTLYKNTFFQKFTYWSQHLFLFNANTIKELIHKAELKVGWIKHIQRYSLSNHLYWLAHGQPGGHQKYSFIDGERLNKEYENQLAALGKTDTIIIGIQKRP